MAVTDTAINFVCDFATLARGTGLVLRSQSYKCKLEFSKGLDWFKPKTLPWVSTYQLFLEYTVQWNPDLTIVNLTMLQQKLQ